MGRNIGIGLIAVLLLVLVALCLAMRAPAIEDHLALEAQNAVTAAGFGAVEVSANGRDLTALVPAELEPTSLKIKEAMSAIRGVRTVDLRFMEPAPEPDPVAEPAPELDPAPAVPAPQELQDQLAELIAQQTIEFESGSDRLTLASQVLLNEAAHLIADRDDVTIEVAGHTDNTGNTEANLRLSRDRAQAVVDYLVTRDVPRAILVPKGYGESLPVATNDTAAGRLRNRRVEFVITPN